MRKLRLRSLLLVAVRCSRPSAALGDGLRVERERRQMSQREAATELGVSQPSVNGVAAKAISAPESPKLPAMARPAAFTVAHRNIICSSLS